MTAPTFKQNSSCSGRIWWILCVLLLVIVAVSVMIITSDNPHAVRLRNSAVRIQIQSFVKGLAFFKEDNGFYPSGSNGLNDLVVRPVGLTNWRQYFEKIPLDPWNHPYIYECPGKRNTNSYDLSSAGPDGKAETEDDIVNWPQPIGEKK